MVLEAAEELRVNEGIYVFFAPFTQSLHRNRPPGDLAASLLYRVLRKYAVRMMRAVCAAIPDTAPACMTRGIQKAFNLF